MGNVLVLRRQPDGRRTHRNDDRKRKKVMQYQGGWPADQSGLTKIAERLVEAALRHGADAADAVAVRGISQSIDVRDGSVEESQRSEGDNVGLRAFVGRRQAVVSTNDLSGHGNGFVDTIAERVVAMARAAPED